jgi:hypothetical protein
MGLSQNFAKPAGSAPVAVLTRRRAFARWKKGRKALKMREPGRNDMVAVLILLAIRVREIEAGLLVKLVFKCCASGRDVGPKSVRDG